MEGNGNPKMITRSNRYRLGGSIPWILLVPGQCWNGFHSQFAQHRLRRLVVVLVFVFVVVGIDASIKAST